MNEEKAFTVRFKPGSYFKTDGNGPYLINTDERYEVARFSSDRNWVEVWAGGVRRWTEVNNIKHRSSGS